ncbi:MAG: HIT domain-containing protein [Candidatus Pacearchaeota archaeon]|nr:HIT domain-containing protein [Candidatus Pacearchaeota archaeon]
MINNESKNQCVFCSIISGNINSCKIDENDKAIAVFEINPISNGHALIISKEHSEKVQKKSLSLAKKIAKRIKTKLKPKDIQISNSNLFGHSVINLIPVYQDENINSKRNPTTMEELERLRAELETKSIKKIKKPKIQQIKEKLWLPKRIP